MGETSKTSNKSIVWNFIGVMGAAVLTVLCMSFVAIPAFVDMFKPDPTLIIVINPTASSNISPEGQPQSSNALIPTSAASSVDLTGIWEFQVTAKQGMGQDGFIRDINASANWVVRIDQEANRLSGEFIGAEGDVPNVCSDASISGTTDGTEVNFVIQFTGPCCQNERMTFSGIYDPQNNTVSGEGEPEDIPSVDCTLWFSDFEATKR